MSQRTCSTPTCERPTYARELCKTHYNRTLPDRHRPSTTPCAWPWCSNTVSKQPRGARRAVCSNECRRLLTFGWSEELPADHWARRFGETRRVYLSTCAWCGNAFTGRQESTIYCRRACGWAAKAARRDALKDGKGTHTRAEVTALWAGNGGRCAYCQRITPRDRIDTEHVIPLSHGGRNDLGNVLPSCRECNTQKGARNPEQWDTWREKNNLPRLTTNLRERWPHLTPNTETDWASAA